MAEVRLDLEGMTCASCAARIEKKLNKLDGVEATVNFATEQATVRTEPAIELTTLIEAVASAGYGAREADPSRAHEHAGSLADLRRRLAVATALTVPLAFLALVPPLQFAGWGWVALALSTPVVFWAGSSFHRAALKNARHLVATMDTLISIGTLAAWLWSTIVLVGSFHADTYFEVPAVITVLVLVGRYFEARAKGRAGDAIRRLLELGAREAHLVRGGEELLVPVGELRPGDVFVVRPGEKIATDGVVIDGDSAVD